MAGKTPPDANDFPSDKGADELIDRGDDLHEEEEQEEEEEEQPRKPAKKAAKKAAKEEEEEEEEEAEEEEEEEAEEEEEEEEEAGKNSSVPLHVLKKSQQKRRDAEKRAQDLEARLKSLEGAKSDRQKEKFDKINERVDELYDEIESARAEGRTKDAAKLQRELDGLRSEMTQTQAAWHATRQAVAQQNLLAFNALVSELEVIDPRFDEGEDEFDEDLVDRVSELTEAYEAKGMSAPEALRKSLRVIIGHDPFREGRRLQRDAKKPAEKAERRKTDVKKNLDAAKKQPPEDKNKTKERSGKVNPLSLNDADFEKLPESTKRQLRGDFIES